VLTVRSSAPGSLTTAQVESAYEQVRLHEDEPRARERDVLVFLRRVERCHACALVGRNVVTHEQQPAGAEDLVNLLVQPGDMSLVPGAFGVDYAAARAGGQDGAPVMFPVGTYWLRRFANVPIAAA
jgi:hypothetical protein